MGSVMTARLIVCYYLTKYLDGVPPGLNVCFQVDVAESGDEELVQYLDSNYLHIDVWDGDSLMYLGSSQLQLRSALRQGAAGVAYEDDIPIAIGQVSEEYRDKMTTSVSHSSGLNIAAMSTPMSPPAVCGTLHVRVVNTGGESKKTGENTKGSQSKECILNDYHHNLNNKPVTISYPNGCQKLIPSCLICCQRRIKRGCWRESMKWRKRVRLGMRSRGSLIGLDGSRRRRI
jgi:hypothetical protein